MKADKGSLELMGLGKLDFCLEEASAWRERIRGPSVHICDCKKDEILKHFDEALRAARGYRTKLKEKEMQGE